MPKNKACPGVPWASNPITEQLVEQEADLSRLPADKHRRKEQRREQVLDRLWEIANLSPEMTRGSITGQVKALAMITAIEGLIPDRRTASAHNKFASPPAPQQMDTADVVRNEDVPSIPDPPPGAAADAPSVLDPAAGHTFNPSEPGFPAHPVSSWEMTPSSPHARVPAAPSAIEKKPSTWRLRL
jgi:hypothetical protein